MSAIRHFLLALQFFTRIPLPGAVAAWVGFSPAMQRASLAYFPLVGWLVGGAAAGVCVLTRYLLPSVEAAPWIAAVLSTILTVMMTGAFHEDGLADLADGLGGAVDRERALTIMKDSRIGSYGSVALILAFLLKISLIAALLQLDMLVAGWAIFTAHVCSRLMPIGVAVCLPNVREVSDSKSATTASRPSVSTCLIAGLWVVLALILAAVYMWLPFWFWGLGFAASVLVCLVMCRLLVRRLQGFTGDALGATQQVCELAFYLGILFGVNQILS